MPATMLADYAEYEQAMGLDWYRLDPNLSFLLDRHLPDPDDRRFAEEHVAPYGPLVGCTLAPRAEETDAHGPVLARYDRWGLEVDEVVHHPTWLQNKADLVRQGFVGLPYHAGRTVPAVVTASRAYLVCQAETAIYCGLGMTGGAADIVERYAPAPVRDELLARLTSLDPEAGLGGRHVPDRAPGRQRRRCQHHPGRPGRRRVGALRGQALLLQRGRRRLHRAGPTRGRAGRDAGSGHLHRPQPPPRRLAQRVRHQAPEAQARAPSASRPARSPSTAPGAGWPAARDPASRRRPATGGASTG